MKKKLLALLMAVVMVTSLTACSSKKSTGDSDKTKTEATEAPASDDTASKSDFVVSMITDTGGVNDQSFNQSAWEGLQELNKSTGAKVSYIESKQETDYTTNLDKCVDDGSNLVWGIGFSMADALKTAASTNPDVSYAIVDNSYGDQTPSNVTGVMFRAQEPSFIVGYIAGKTTTTGKVGFVGGISSDLIDQFEYGYKAGVDYAANELGKKITVDAQYAESFSDAAKGKAIANKMFSDGCDIVFHAAGGVGVGVIEAAKEANKFAIGVDRDQAYLAPKNVLTSALKLVGTAVKLVSEKAAKGEQIGGQTFTFGLTEDAVGIPDKNPNMDPAVYEAAMKVQQSIKDGTIVPPSNKDTYKEFGKTLSK
ncbi:BMP family lipoprotein [Anaeromicropila herbilytica]|uniref:BMP family ABC transporter substrate-binding protein n=1 Tax=Anaeromicropila herbilytica TaxID=2785025 RepID=A0A7R7EPD3_9FIRM|nr:BMP family ABC transporter substrate-binding protein [Anaeromicropila herbilytica]BCN32255.1 BMP family ABC transporter substrate-binding protein [Anaeromicropila herbilytica]